MRERALAQLAEKWQISLNALRGVENEMESMRMYEGGQEALKKFHDGRRELLSHDVACIYDLAANRFQDARAAFGQIRSMISALSTSGAARKASRPFQLHPKNLPARSNPDMGANCERSTPAKCTPWPMSVVLSAPQMAPIERYSA